MLLSRFFFNFKPIFNLQLQSLYSLEFGIKRKNTALIKNVRNAEKVGSEMIFR
mgnify:CR=1 FL=1